MTNVPICELQVMPSLRVPEVPLGRGFLRIIALSVLACAARRVKFFQKAIDALAEARQFSKKRVQ